MTSEGRVSLRLADVKRYGVPYFGRSDAESDTIHLGTEVTEQKTEVVELLRSLGPKMAEDRTD